MPSESIHRKTRKILVVEDDALVADVIAAALNDNGYDVVGPVPTLHKGLELARNADLDGALLDVNLGGLACFPIAEVLRDRNVPFLFVTGANDPATIPPELRWARRLSKPFRLARLETAAAEAFGGSD